ncbi:MAG TPA: deoxyribodipyrimidine photo-lyase [Opitutaceae bacterium]|nr:deoxyribodipyrimidine photo-lyase [Opitutaceae bacterium]
MILVWFRQDLRLQDNPALSAAAEAGEPIVPVYIWDEDGEGAWPPGAASRWWIHHSLVELDRSLRGRGLRLVVRRGPSHEVLAALAAAAGARAVFWNRRYEPSVRERDARVESVLGGSGIAARSFNGSLLFEPHTVANRAGRPFQVFGPFWRHCLTLPVAEPSRLPPGKLRAPARWPKSLMIDELGLLPQAAWAGKFAPLWQPGEAGGQARLRRFAAHKLGDYADRRDDLAEDGTSRLSPWLHHGEISPRQVWDVVRRRSRKTGVFPAGRGEAVFLNEIGWREFGYHLLWHFPQTPDRPLRTAFERFPWARDPAGRLLRLWQQGRTGFPIVDAGMRQLWATGWMHNRARMIAASFLVKDLRLPWMLGARWFWDTLVDADLANNTLGWQWSAGCGADAAPYFRIFSPDRQARRFDPHGSYARRWLPAGESPPAPCVDHAAARDEALAAFRSLSA